MSTSMLRLHAIRLIKSVLASTKTKKLQDVLEAAFGSDEEDDEDIPTEEEKEEEASNILSGQKENPSTPGQFKMKGIPPHQGRHLCFN